MEAPALDYKPATHVHPAKIALVGAGAIAPRHLAAYKNAGYDVAAICDDRPGAAAALRDEFYPNAAVFEDYRRALEIPEIDVVDATSHPDRRHNIIRDALLAKKHVLSQKPFTTDLAKGEELRALAAQQGVLLAVNQNARWAPHFRYAALLARGGHVGKIMGVHMSVAWDHTWIAGTGFEKIRHLILYDFGIHWFDMLCVFMGGERAERVYASVAHAAGQNLRPPMLGQAAVEYANAQATLSFEGVCPVGKNNRFMIVGDAGTIISEGTDNNDQVLTLRGKEGECRPALEGKWFTDGFHGAMAELLSAIAERRDPENSAGNVMRGLELCFAALASADSGKAVVPGEAGARALRG